MESATAAKYDKLAAEYTKLKSQVAVLKKAYLDEHEECSQIKDQLKEKDQWMRKCDQEVDSLNFRNQQLSRRVEVLKGELDLLESQQKKHKHKKGDGNSFTKLQRSTSVYDEELRGKMEENTRLQAQLQELSIAYEHQIIGLEETVKKCEDDCRHHAGVVASLQQSSNGRIEALQQEKAIVEGRAQSQENDIRDYRNRAEVAEQKLVSVQGCLQAGLARAARIISNQLPFIDTKHRELNVLNLPRYDRKHQARARELIGQAATMVGELTHSLSKFFTYSEQRSRIFPADGQSRPQSPVNVKYCQYLRDNLSYLRPVEQCLKLFSEELKEESLIVLETATDLQELAKNFSHLVNYCNKLLPYQVLSLEEESRVDYCPPILAGKNKDLLASLKRFNSVLHKISTYLTLLSMQSRQMGSHPVSSHGKAFRLLSRTLDQLHDAARDLSKVYNSKVSLEHQLPTATPKLKTLDECVVSSLVSLVTSAGKMSTFMVDNLEFLTESTECCTTSSGVEVQPSSEGPRFHPQVTEFQHRAARFLTSLNSQARPDSVPHRTARENRCVLANSMESREGLGRQMALFQERAGRLEQDKEHLVLEMQLLKVKYDAEQQKAKTLQRELKVLHSSSGSTDGTTDVKDDGDVSNNIAVPSSAEWRTDSMGSTGLIETSILGHLQTEERKGTGDSEGREEMIKEHFTQRLNAMTRQIQLADSKAVASQAEVRALFKQLRQVEKAKNHAHEEVQDAAQTILQLQDELTTTAESYENQLSMMSDHLAGMNDRLAQQKDEIDDLRAQQEQSKGALSRMSRKFKR